MSDRERETLEEIKKILGFDPKEAADHMLENLERGILSIPKITDEQRQKIRELRERKAMEESEKPKIGGTFTFKASDIKITPLEKILGHAEDNWSIHDESQKGGDNDESDELEKPTRLDQYMEIIDEAVDIFQERNLIYRDTFVVVGLIGTVSTLIGDCHRLRNMIIQSPDHGREYTEQITDKLIDVINQAVISMMMLREENYEGK